ncbi:MAG: GAF domain-containing protein [Hyphomicrobiales bacterium]|nr:GAF domain-containing protein [Hyphomicrobiales bacterium]
MEASPHPQQAERLAALRGMNILDTPRELSLDNIVQLVADICETPMALLSLVDENRQWFKSEVGLGIRETPLQSSICAHAILDDDLTIIADTLNDPRSSDNPLCIDAPNLRFYAGAVLRTQEGLPIGTLCVLDTTPRTLSETQQKALKVLADQVMAQIQLREDVIRADMAQAELNHRIKNSLALITALLGLQASISVNREVKAELNVARDRVMAVANLHDHLHASGFLESVDLSSFLKRLVDNLKAQAPAGVLVQVEGTAQTVDSRQAVNIGIVVNELATNSMKHGFPDGKPGVIRIISSSDGDTTTVAVIDNGIGLPDGFDPKNSKGLGMRVAVNLARDFGEGLSWSSVDGRTEFRIQYKHA